MGNIQQIIWAFLVTLVGRPSRSAAHRKSWSWTYGFRCKKILINQTFANFIKWYGFMSIFRNFILFSKIETSCVSFFKNGPSPASLCLFSFFTKNITILTINLCQKCPSSIQRWDSNPPPTERESPPITTRPGLPSSCCWSFSWVS